jgi:hypothetical protein
MLIKLDMLSPEAREQADKLGILQYLVTPDSRTYGFRLSKHWGIRLVETTNPLGTQIAADADKKIQLIDPFPRIPAEIWTRWMKLAFHFVDTTRQNDGIDRVSEVSCKFSRKNDDPTSWDCWIPKQTVGGGSVHANFGELVNIVTGEKIDHWPPDGSFDAGSSHSHNTMSAFFSQTDDNSELGCPGFHAVVGKLDRKTSEYEIATSIVLDKRRFMIEESDKLVDLDPKGGLVDFHKNVLDVISTVNPTKVVSSVATSHRAELGRAAFGLGDFPNSADAVRRTEENAKKATEIRPLKPFEEHKIRQARQGTVFLSDNKTVKTGQIKSAVKRMAHTMKVLMSDADGLTEVLDQLERLGLKVEFKK